MQRPRSSITGARGRRDLRPCHRVQEGNAGRGRAGVGGSRAGVRGDGGAGEQSQLRARAHSGSPPSPARAARASCAAGRPDRQDPPASASRAALPLECEILAHRCYFSSWFYSVSRARLQDPDSLVPSPPVSPSPSGPQNIRPAPTRLPCCSWLAPRGPLGQALPFASS